MWPGWKMQSSYVYDTPENKRSKRVSAMKRKQRLRVSAQPPSALPHALPRSDAPCANSSAAEKPSGGSSCGVDAIGADEG